MEGTSEHLISPEHTEALIRAAADGDGQETARLLRLGVSANCCGPFRVTPLMAAAREGRLDIMTQLIAAGANIDAEDEDGETAIHRAVRRFQDDALDLLIRAGGNMDSVDRYGAGPFLQAAMDGNLYALKRLSEEGIDPCREDLEGRTALLWAAVRNRIELLPVIFEMSPAKVTDCSARNGRTALMEAALRGNLEIVKTLLGKGADCNLIDAEGSTALHLALRKRRGATAMLLIPKTENLDAPNSGGFSPMVIAARNNLTECVEALLSHGADPRSTDRNGKSALYWAQRKRHSEIVQILSTHMWGINEAAAEGDLDRVNALLDANAAVNCRDQYGETPLHRAAWEGHAQIVEALLRRGADPSATTDYGKTPLHRASRTGHTDIIRALVNAGAWMDAPNAEGETALHWAARGGHFAAAELLCDMGASPGIRNRHGKTPAETARAQGFEEVAALLEEACRLPEITFTETAESGTEDLWLTAKSGDESLGRLKFCREGATVTIKFITIRRDKRKRGIGRAMVEHVARFADTIIAQSVKSEARRFWSELGFTADAEGKDWRRRDSLVPLPCTS